MSKSRGNAIMLRATADETRALVKRAKTDTDRNISYDPETRPEVANLLLLISLCTGESPQAIAEKLGDGGGGALKNLLTDTLNDSLAPIRARRNELAEDADAVVKSVLSRGTAEANRVAEATLGEMRAR
ncbi:MAG: hypothetical protein QM756_01085 [Polyangiaceae bacterium]